MPIPNLYNEFSGKTLAAARLYSSISFSIIGAVLVNSPAEILGPSGELNHLGAVFSLTIAVFGLLSIAGMFVEQVWAYVLAGLIVITSVGVFSLSVPSDPVTAGACVLWQIHNGLLLMAFFIGQTQSKKRIKYKKLKYRPGLAALKEPRSRAYVATSESEDFEQFSDLKKWFARYRKPFTHLVIVSVIQVVLIFGFVLTKDRLAIDIVILSNLLVFLISFRFIYLLFFHDATTQKEAVFAGLFILVGLTLVFLHGFIGYLILFASQCFILYLLMQRSPFMREAADRFKDAPAIFVLVSFVVLIAIGALFLSLPAASVSGQSIGAVPAIFTAVSAACVTGLSVVRVGQDLSGFGQAIVLILIQLGGLGIMVLSTFATIAFGGRLGVKTERAFSGFFESRGVRSTNNLVMFIVKSTVILEALGAAVLSTSYARAGYPIEEAIKYGVFHSISAFCNAGFSLSEGSLIELNQNPMAMLTFSLLITLGGLGFFVMLEIFSRMVKRSTGPMSVHAKLVILVSVIFTFGGAIIFTVTEWEGAYAEFSYPLKFLNGFFHSVSLRTAGFNSVDLAQYGYASFVVMLVLMFIGGAPGGTAGGVKVSTVGVLLATLPALLKNSNRVSVFRRTLTAPIIYKSAALVVLSLSTICVLLFVLFLTQDVDPMSLIFEVFSAVGTVGLSLGATSELDGFGQIVVSIGMFIGRIGPLTVAIALGKEVKSKVSYPDANVMVG